MRAFLAVVSFRDLCKRVFRELFFGLRLSRKVRYKRADFRTKRAGFYANALNLRTKRASFRIKCASRLKKMGKIAKNS